MGLYRFWKNSYMMRSGLPQKGRETKWASMLLPALFVAAYIYAPGFFTISNLLLIVNQIAVTAAVSGCIALVMAAGHFDLSIGSAISVANITCCLLLKNVGSMPLAVAGTLLLGLSMGLVNGYFVGIKDLSSFCVTLATQIGFEGLAFIVGGGGFIYRAVALQPLVYRRLLGLPLGVWVLFILLLVLQFILNNTLLGRYLLAAGYRYSSAQAAGIDVKKIVLTDYILVGFMTGVIGVIYTARIGAGFSVTSTVYAYDGILANLLGGNRISGGKSSVLRAVAGACLWGVLQSYMGYVGISYYYQRIVKCMIILYAVSRDKKIQKKLMQVWN